MVLGESPDGLGLNGVADYTFTDQELTDILGYMEANDPLASSLPLPAVTGNFQALQFLPRSQDSLPAHPSLSFPSTSAAAAEIESIKSEPIVSDYKGDLGSFSIPQPSPQSQAPHTSSRGSGRSGQNGHKGDLPSGRKPSSRKGLHGRSTSSEYKHGHISHSTVEKQRRDRINALIDELRELVPSQASDGPPQEGSSDSRRPKHVVLSDTIALVKNLQIKVRDTPPQSRTVSGDCDEAGSVEAREARPCPRKVGAGEVPQTSSRDSEERSGSPPALPLAPEGGGAVAPGVVVEEGDSCLYVKVNCKDRRGLLSDIILSLKSMPLEITTAAVTTGSDGHVHDVFQVRLDPKSGVSPRDVQSHVHGSLYSSDLEGLGDKRRRTEEV